MKAKKYAARIRKVKVIISGVLQCSRVIVKRSILKGSK
jgi:hypothetical protein